MTQAQLDELIRAGIRAKRARAVLARTNINTFAEYVIKDEETGAPVRQARLHERWQTLADENNRCLVWSAVEHAKTWQMSIIRPMFMLGQRPSLRIVIVSNTAGQAKKIAKPLLQYIESSDELHEVFPDLVRSKDPRDPWHSEAMVVNRGWFAKDPSLQVVGIHGSILGARIDVLILDDILDFENTRTKSGRDDTMDWVQSALMGRLTKHSRVIVVGTAFHPDDALHRFARLPGWVGKRFPAVDRLTGQFAWPERWDADRLEQRRRDLDQGPIEFARQMMCEARDDSTSRFQRTWIDNALARGLGRPFTYALKRVPEGYRVYTGVDLAVSSASSADLSSLFTILVHPNEDREVLNIESGRWSGPEIIGRIQAVHTRYNGIIVVENNGAQDFLLQFMRNQTAIPVVPHTTGKDKHSVDYGIESLAAEMANGKWIIPNPGDGKASPEIAAWIQDMLFYSPGAHTGDRLMACWFAKEQARKQQRVVQPGSFSIDLLGR